MIIKSPPCYDISHWKVVPDFKAIYPKPFLMITKATEGINYIDPTFVRYMIGMKEAGYHRGAYHFHRKIYKGQDQARHFISITSGYIDINTLLILDAEEGGEKVSELWSWFETVRAKYPNNRLMLYGRKNILDPLVMTTAEAEYFRRIPVWTAGYPASPDEYNTPPSAYIPNPLKFGPVYLWQYTDHGRIDGISGDVDCNWISPNLQLFMGQPQTPTEPPPTSDGENPMALYEGNAKLTSTPNVRIRKPTASGDLDPIGMTIGAIQPGQAFKGDQIALDPSNREWIHITEVGGKVINGWSAAWLLDYHEVTPPPPPPPTVVKVPFTLSVEGYKPYSGELEKA